MSDGKRRLPIVDSQRPGPSGARPPWQWMGIGMGVIFLFWMPLAYVAQLAARAYWASRLGETAAVEVAQAYERLDEASRLELQIALGAAPAVAFVVAAVIGGLVVGRFDEGSGLRDATVSGASVAVVVAILALVMSPDVLGGLAWLVATAAISLLGAGAARFGAWLGRDDGGDP